MKNEKIVSVFIPTFNGEKYLQELIVSLAKQKLPDNYILEILVTDSGSTDGTLEIIRAFGDKLIFKQIPNTEFGHGKTRQQAAEAATGDYILFLSQDATPYNEYWLINMLEPFFFSNRIGCVFGRQIPRVDAPPTIKREVHDVFSALGASGNILLQKNGSFITDTVDEVTNNFFSDVNSAVRRKLLITEIPFRDVAYAEDQALAQDMQKKGYVKAYSPDGAVWHSNEYTAKEYYHRKFDEYNGLMKSTGLVFSASKSELLAGWIKPTIKDILFAINDREYSLKIKIKHILFSPLFNISNSRGKFDAVRYINSTVKQSELSLESMNKSKK